MMDTAALGEDTWEPDAAPQSSAKHSYSTLRQRNGKSTIHVSFPFFSPHL